MAKISLTELTKASQALDEALKFFHECESSSVQEIAKDAVIQRFEFCVELAWKLSAKTLGSSSTAPKPVIREMAQNNLIDDPKTWFEFIEARNKSSHTYDRKIADEVFQIAIQFQDSLKLLIEKFK